VNRDQKNYFAAQLEERAQHYRIPLWFRILYSIAVSLKRIADNTQKVEVNITMDFSAMHGDITNIAWEAGRSFQHGTRTDR
jgi:hypothetical protein